MRLQTAGFLERSIGGFSKELAAPAVWLLLWLAIMQPADFATLWGMGYMAIMAWLGYEVWQRFGEGGGRSAPATAPAEAAPVEELVESGRVDASKVFEATIVLQRLEDRGIARGLTLHEVLEVLGYLTPRNPHGVQSR